MYIVLMNTNLYHTLTDTKMGEMAVIKLKNVKIVGECLIPTLTSKLMLITSMLSM